VRRLGMRISTDLSAGLIPSLSKERPHPRSLPCVARLVFVADPR
jgi:hypothetical protein